MKFNQAKESVNPMDISTEIKNALVSLMVAEGGEVEYAVVDREHTSWNEDVQCFDHQAWEELIVSMPDTTVFERPMHSIKVYYTTDPDGSGWYAKYNFCDRWCSTEKRVAKYSELCDYIARKCKAWIS